MPDYSNRHGTATLTPVGPVLQARDVRCDDSVIAQGLTWDVDTAAKLALITGNDRLQPAYSMKHRCCYVLLHHTPSTVQFCRLDSLTYTGDDPHATLDRLNRMQPAHL